MLTQPGDRRPRIAQPSRRSTLSMHPARHTPRSLSRRFHRDDEPVIAPGNVQHTHAGQAQHQLNHRDTVDHARDSFPSESLNNPSVNDPWHPDADPHLPTLTRGARLPSLRCGPRRCRPERSRCRPVLAARPRTATHPQRPRPCQSKGAHGEELEPQTATHARRPGPCWGER